MLCISYLFPVYLCKKMVQWSVILERQPYGWGRFTLLSPVARPAWFVVDPPLSIVVVVVAPGVCVNEQRYSSTTRVLQHNLTPKLQQLEYVRALFVNSTKFNIAPEFKNCSIPHGKHADNGRSFMSTSGTLRNCCGCVHSSTCQQPPPTPLPCCLQQKEE